VLVCTKNQNLFSNQAQKFLILKKNNHKFKILKNQAQTHTPNLNQTNVQISVGSPKGSFKKEEGANTGLNLP
jgi:hypothetical protein